MDHPWDRRLGVWHIAADFPDQPAIVESPEGAFTYQELVDRAHRLVHLLRSRGVGHGDVVAALLPNGADIVTVNMASLEGGFWFLPLNTFLTASELSAIIEHSGTSALIAHGRFASALDGARPRLLFGVGDVPGAEPFAASLAEQPNVAPPDRRPGSLFTYTSGTTGKPKGIKRPVPAGDPDDVAHDAAVFGRAFDFRPFTGAHLVSTAMYHGGSLSYWMGALNVGHPLAIMAKFDPEQALALIERHGVVSAYMVPTQFHRMMRLPEAVRNAYDVSSLRGVVHSAAPCPLTLKQQMMEWWGPVVWETYGGMEGAATIAKPQRWLERPGTVGRAVKGVRISIRDEQGAALPPGEIGSIYYGTDSTSFEYTGEAETTTSVKIDDQFTIGDIGFLDDDGYLFIRDRAKDMIITGGVNVFPQEVEAVLLEHPAVADVGVIGIPDTEWGESVLAVVQPADGADAGESLAAELVEWCRSRLASYKCPRAVEFRDELPRTDAGKLYKRRLRDEFWRDTGRAV